MSKNEIKSKIQKEALTEAMKVDFSLVLAATGVGKSKIGVDYSKEIVNTKKNARILIVVPTEKLRDENWKEEFEKWKAKTIWGRNIIRSCYASISKIENDEFDLVILDEVHNITENNSSFFYQNKVHKAIGLTATAPEDVEKAQILDELKFEVVYKIDLDEAVKLGLVSPYEIVIVETRLDTKDKYVKSGTKDKPFYQTEKAKYDYLDRTVRRMMFSSNPRMKSGLKFKLLERMRFIYNLKSKTKVAQYLLDNVIPEDERTLIFSGSIDQAEELCDNTFHSKTNDKDYNAFKAEEINRMSCVNAVNEGHNLPKLDNGLVVQLNSKELNFIQRVGRIVRYRDGHKAKIYVICAIDTQDEKWVKKAIENFDQTSISYVRFENLKNNKISLDE